MHVLTDLRPYICTFSDCDYGLIQFSTRGAWAEHEYTNHRFEVRWKCVKCTFEATSPDDWERHLEEAHFVTFSGPELIIATDRARIKNPRPSEDEDCHLCKTKPATSRRAFEKHVGKHMEEMALFALPQDNEDDWEDISDVTDDDLDALVQPHFESIEDNVVKLLEAVADKAIEARAWLRRIHRQLPEIDDVGDAVKNCYKITSKARELVATVGEFFDQTAYQNIKQEIFGLVRSLQYTFDDFFVLLEQGTPPLDEALPSGDAWLRKVWRNIDLFFRQQNEETLARRLLLCTVLQIHYDKVLRFR